MLRPPSDVCKALVWEILEPVCKAAAPERWPDSSEVLESQTQGRAGIQVSPSHPAFNSQDSRLGKERRAYISDGKLLLQRGTEVQQAIVHLTRHCSHLSEKRTQNVLNVPH